jgi:alginate O-acetyltransferase complex protein AlgI
MLTERFSKLVRIAHHAPYRQAKEIQMTPIVKYFITLLLVFSGACVRPRLLKQSLMLAASYVFYAAWGTTFLAVLIASSLLNFGLGSLVRRRPTLTCLWVGVTANLSLLGFFKYLPPLASGAPVNFLHKIVMPVGMSFWTFEALSYLIDIYREEAIDPSLLEFCLYMSFWPTVLMGPVCRLPRLLPQLREVHGISSTNLAAGLGRIGTGLFMKLILAQFLGSTLARASAIGVHLSGGEHTWAGLDVWFIAIGFGFQLFFDFAGYSHIVIGAAKLFGFSLEENFDSPYLSLTPSIFWTKWHMSLSSWIRDYVFVPTATLRYDRWWRYFAVFFSMVLFGLWHGATITFLLWGAYQGVLLVLHRTLEQYQRRFGITMDGISGSFLGWIVTFLAISLGWVLFRTNDITQALLMFRAVLSPVTYLQPSLPSGFYRVVLSMSTGYFAYSILTSTFVREKWQDFLNGGDSSVPVQRLLRFSWENRWWWVTPMIATIAIFAGLAVLVQSARVTPFIYTLF